MGDAVTGHLDEAFYFQSSEYGLFAWLHHSTQHVADVGVVICKPFGYEALCGHRSVREFAVAIAGLGLPTLRFDYRSAGDSQDADPDSCQINDWVDDIVAAAAELRRRAGVTRVVFVGFRLGALLATLAAQRCADVAGVALVAPIVEGRRYLRELKTARLAALMGSEVASSGPDGTDGAIEGGGLPSGALEFSGYVMSARTMEILGQQDLASGCRPVAANILVIDRSDLPAARRLRDLWSEAGAAVSYQTLPGFVEMMMVTPDLSVTPQPVLAAVLAWLQSITGIAAGALSGTGGGRRGLWISPGAVVTLPGAAPEESVTELPVLVGPDRMSFGILTRPRQDEARRRAVLMLNTGADSHIGASRMNVTLARRWAQRGYVVLRIDLAGLGDAEARPGCSDNDVFPEAAVDDIGAAVRWLRDDYNAGEVTLAGLCSGAYHALKAAAAGLPVSRILLVNPQTFFRRQGQALSEIEIVGSLGVHSRRARSLRNWTRLLSGQVDVRRIIRANTNRLRMALGSKARELARRLHIRVQCDLYWELRDIAARGVRVVFVFAHNEPGMEVFKMLLGSSIRRLGSNCHLHIIHSADHTFSRSAPRALMAQVLSDELYAHPESSAITGSAAAQPFHGLQVGP